MYCLKYIHIIKNKILQCTEFSTEINDIHICQRTYFYDHSLLMSVRTQSDLHSFSLNAAWKSIKYALLTQFTFITHTSPSRICWILSLLLISTVFFRICKLIEFPRRLNWLHFYRKYWHRRIITPIVISNSLISHIAMPKIGNCIYHYAKIYRQKYEFFLVFNSTRTGQYFIFLPQRI